jgi:hypothetical protein
MLFGKNIFRALTTVIKAFETPFMFIHWENGLKCLLVNGLRVLCSPMVLGTGIICVTEIVGVTLS